jgi:GNAT superfamily N-acetyltransferase
LTWDGDIPYVAMLVEDSWQRQGIGTALPRRLIAVGADAGTQTARAVTDADNEPMVRTIRNVGAQIDRTVSSTTRLTVNPVAEPVHGAVVHPA